MTGVTPTTRRTGPTDELAHRSTEPEWDPHDLAAELLRLVASRLTFQDSLPDVLATLTDRLDWPVAGLWMLERHTDVLRCAGFTALRPERVKRLERRSRAASFSEGEGIPGRAWRSRVPIVADDVAGDPRWRDLEPEERLEAVVAFPLVADGRVVGVVELLDGPPRSVPAPLQRALAVLGNDLGRGLERFLAAEAAGMERARLESALAAGRMGVWDWDVGADELRWSSTLESMTGLPAGSFGGTVEDFVSTVHPDDRDDVLEQFLHALEPGSDRVVDVQYRAQIPGAGMRWLHAVGRSVLDPTGRVVAMTGVAVDVTDPVRQVDAARRDAAHLHIALETAGLGAWRWFRGSETGWWSESTVEMVGRGPVGGGPVTAEDVLASLHPDDRHVVDEMVAAASSRRDFHAVYRVVRPDGRVVRMESRGRPFFDTAGDLVGVAGVSALLDDPDAPDHTDDEAEDDSSPR